jgi:DNA-directed RNA polymerase specialized sigma24 family protein
VDLDRGVEDLLRGLAPQVLAALVRRHGQFDTCEDATQEALLAAATRWPTEGVPDNPRGWLVTVASRRWYDQMRSEYSRRRREYQLAAARRRPRQRAARPACPSGATSPAARAGWPEVPDMSGPRPAVPIRRARAPATRARVLAAAALLLAAAAGCGTPREPGPAVPAPTAASPGPSAPASAPASPLPPSRPAAVRPSASDPVLVGAGDIASCSSSGDEATAKLLDGIPGTVFTVGDNAYPDGSAGDFADCYQPGWGRHRDRTRPAVGNHEYQTRAASGYFGYFAAAAGPPGRGYYSYNLAGWHVVVLNSTCSGAGCQAGSAQERWLRADLAASGARCTLAYWHHPLFTSGRTHGPATWMRPLFRALYDFRAELVVTGHNHQYERFAPQDPDGRLDPGGGIREFVAGTGGASHYPFGRTQANSEVRNSDTYGVLQLTLHPDGYEWRFVPQDGQTFTDAGAGACR